MSMSMYVYTEAERRQQQDAALTPPAAAAAAACALFDADQAEIFKIENMLEMQHIAEVVGRGSRGLYELHKTGSTQLDECPTEWRGEARRVERASERPRLLLFLTRQQ